MCSCYQRLLLVFVVFGVTCWGNSGVSRAGHALLSTDECIVTASCVDDLHEEEPDPLMIGEIAASWYVKVISGTPAEQPIHA